MREVLSCQKGIAVWWWRRSKHLQVFQAPRNTTEVSSGQFVRPNFHNQVSACVQIIVWHEWHTRGRHFETVASLYSVPHCSRCKRLIAFWSKLRKRQEIKMMSYSEASHELSSGDEYGSRLVNFQIFTQDALYSAVDYITYRTHAERFVIKCGFWNGLCCINSETDLGIGLPGSMRRSMGCSWGSKRKAMVYDLARHATLLTKCQQWLYRNESPRNSNKEEIR